MTLPTRITPDSPMTTCQRQTLDFIANYIDRHGYPPTVKDIGLEFGGITSQAVFDRFRALEARGLITRTPRLARGIALTQLGKEKTGRAGRQPLSQAGAAFVRTSPIVSGQAQAAVASSSEGDHT